MKYFVLLIICLLSSSKAFAHDIKLSGTYVWGDEVHTFQPCNQKIYWVDISGWVLDPLLKYYKKNTTAPYQPIYLSVRGHIHNEKSDGYEADYDGIFHISEIYSFTTKIPEGC